MLRMARPVPKSEDSPRAGCCFGAFFALFALPFLGFFVWQGYKDIRCFTTYKKATCTILNKQMLQSSSDGSTTYRPEFTFEFVDEYENIIETKGYDNWDVYSSGYSGKKKVLDRYQIGQSYPCWYDPQNPRNAVLERRISWMYLFALIPITFILVGGGLVYSALRRGGRGASPESRALKDWKAKKPKPLQQELKIRPGQVLPIALSRENAKEPGVGCLIFSVVFIAAGIVVYMQWANSLWGLALALCILGTIGTMLCLLTLANRRRLRKVQVEVNAAELIPGQKLECFVSLRGHTELNAVTVSLVCEERATYRRGTDTITDKKRVVDEKLVEETEVQIDPLKPFGLRGQVDLPQNAMHTFKADRNEIAWFLRLDCDIPRWPDSHFSYPLKVAARWKPSVPDAKGS